MQANDKERVLTTKNPINGKHIRFAIWKPALTEEQKKQQDKDVKEGKLPF